MSHREQVPEAQIESVEKTPHEGGRVGSAECGHPKGLAEDQAEGQSGAGTRKAVGCRKQDEHSAEETEKIGSSQIGSGKKFEF